MPPVFLGCSRVLALVPTSSFLPHALPQRLVGHGKALTNSVRTGQGLLLGMKKALRNPGAWHPHWVSNWVEEERRGKGARGVSGKQKSKGVKAVASQHENCPVTSGQDACRAVGFMQVKNPRLMEAWSKSRWASGGRTVRRDVVTLK